MSGLIPFTEHGSALLHESSEDSVINKSNCLKMSETDCHNGYFNDGQERKKMRKEIIQKKIAVIEKAKKENANKQDDVGSEFGFFPCCEQYANPLKLFLHIKKHHNKDATQCALCCKELSSKSSLDRHLLTHAKLQPFDCAQCNKKFTTNGNMRRHMRTHKGTFKDVIKRMNGIREVQRKKGKRNFTRQSNNARLEEQTSHYASAVKEDMATFPAGKISSTKKISAEELPDGKDAVKSECSKHKKPRTENCNNEAEGSHKSDLTISPKANVEKSVGVSTANESVGIVDAKVTTENNNEKVSKSPNDFPRSRESAKRLVKPNRFDYRSRKRSRVQESHLLPNFPTPVQDFYDIHNYHSHCIQLTSLKFPLVAKSICETVERTLSPSLQCYCCKICNIAFPCKRALGLHQEEHKKLIASNSSNQMNQKEEFFVRLGLQPACSIKENEDPSILWETSEQSSEKMSPFREEEEKYSQKLENVSNGEADLPAEKYCLNSSSLSESCSSENKLLRGDKYWESSSNISESCNSENEFLQKSIVGGPRKWSPKPDLRTPAEKYWLNSYNMSDSYISENEFLQESMANSIRKLKPKLFSEECKSPLNETDSYIQDEALSSVGDEATGCRDSKEGILDSTKKLAVLCMASNAILRLRTMHKESVKKGRSMPGKQQPEEQPEQMQICIKGSNIKWESGDCSRESRESSLDQEDEDNQDEYYGNADRELVIDCDPHNDFADIPSILSNVAGHTQVVSDLPLKNNENNCTSNPNGDSVGSQNVYWLPESPESSLEGDVSTVTSPEVTTKFQEARIKRNPAYVCVSCKKEFKNKSILGRHALKHEREKPFKCTVCKTKLTNGPNALRHVMNVHKIQKKPAKAYIIYDPDREPGIGTKTVCEWCGKDFKSNLILEHHKRATSGCIAKPFKCLKCNRTFATKNNGKRHQNKHHSSDDQPDNCIVKNEWFKNGNNGDRLFQGNVDEAGEMSDKSLPIDSNSECQDSDLQREDRLSLPEKELDAAQSLIDMFTQASPNKHAQIFNDSCNQSAIDMQGNVQTDVEAYIPVDMCRETDGISVDIQPQESPLDLSVRAMDLSQRIEDSYFEVVKIYSNAPDTFSPSDLRTSKVAKSQDDFTTPTPLNLVCKEKQDFTDQKFNFPKHGGCSNSISPLTRISDIPSHAQLEVDMIANWSDSASNSSNAPAQEDIKMQCNYCSVTFANKSNKRRHEKRQHMLQAEQEMKGHFPSSGLGKISKRGKSVLSKKTKEALLTKVSSGKPNSTPTDFEEPSNHQLASNVETTHPLGVIGNESENIDLASVSSLINTANSPQLKQYLTTDGSCDVATPERIPAGSDTESDRSTKTNDEKLDGNRRGSDKYFCSICDKKFKCKSAINRHFVTHTKEKPFNCPECKMRFTTKSNAERHSKKKHKAHLSSPTLSPEVKYVLSGKKRQKKSSTPVSSESSASDIDTSLKKDVLLPKELANTGHSQCNKENQRLYMPS